MATSALPTTTNQQRVVVERHAARVKDAIRAGRSRANEAVVQAWNYVRNVAKSALSSNRSRCIEQTVALVIDIAQRGNLDDAEAIGHELIAIARAEYGAAHPDQRFPQLSVAEAHMLEEHAEGLVEEAETALAHHNTLTNRLRYLSQSAAHTRTRHALDEAVRRENARSS